MLVRGRINNIKVKLGIYYLMMIFYRKEGNTPLSTIRFGLSAKIRSMQKAGFAKI